VFGQQARKLLFSVRNRKEDNMALNCERCGEVIQEIDGFDSMERGLEYD
jgi:hypothetical protein